MGVWSGSLDYRHRSHALLTRTGTAGALERVRGIGIVAATVTVEEEHGDAQVVTGRVWERIDELGGVAGGVCAWDGVLMSPGPVALRFDRGAVAPGDRVQPVAAADDRVRTRGAGARVSRIRIARVVTRRGQGAARARDGGPNAL